MYSHAAAVSLFTHIGKRYVYAVFHANEKKIAHGAPKKYKTAGTGRAFSQMCDFNVRPEAIAKRFLEGSHKKRIQPEVCSLHTHKRTNVYIFYSLRT